ncbi:MAG: polysaccharide deacetylase family protein, partial [Planctomycetota bacterium]|jgi:peptidoglycan/xylan/chitin deacetylase (PgdA/CDA1 family)
MGAVSQEMYVLPFIRAIATENFSTNAALDSCLILQYHRVASLCHDPLQLAVQPHNFERQMEYLAENFDVISTDDMKLHLETSTPFDNNTVVVTFDGGYSDILYTAKEILEEYAIPATVFTSSAGITKDGQLWQSELEDILIAAEPRGNVKIEIDGKCYTLSLRNRREAFRTFDVLYSIMPDMTPPVQRRILSQIRRSLDCQGAEPDPHSVMNSRQLQMLEDGGLITIGGHTHNFAKLSALPKWRQIEELARNKEVLEEALSHPVEYFSYPFGNEDSHTKETAEMLEDIGFTLAFGSSYGTVSAAGETNCYELPRVKVGNWNPFTFYRFLEGFFT